jgi:DNA-binding MarR family transcriptional regulator
VARRAVSTIETHLGYWLRYVSNHVSHAFRLKLEGRGVTVAEWVVLRELFDRDAASPSEIADRLGMTRGAISKLADRLEHKSLATRSADKNDRRFQTLSLTAAGRTLVPGLAELADLNDEEFFGHLSASERRRLERTMKDIVGRRALKAVPVE